MLKKIKFFLLNFFYAFSYGLKNAESEMFVSKNSSNSDSDFNLQIKDTNIGKDLLKGEVTQEVEDLRYSTYSVYKESKNYEYIGDGVAIKKDKVPFDINNFKFTQRNKKFCMSIKESLDCEVFNGIDDFTLSIVYYNTPRFKLERFVDFITVRGLDGNVEITLRFDKSYDLSNPLTKMFFNELMKLNTSDRNNEIFNENIDTLCFTTYKSQGEDDFVMYIFYRLKPKSYEFFDNYVNVVFSVDDFVREDLTEKFFSKDQNKRYLNKDKKSNDFKIPSLTKSFHCSTCGCEMNQYDYEITLHDIGKPLCVKCLENHLTFMG